MTNCINFEKVTAKKLNNADHAEILAMCNVAYGEDVSLLFAAYKADVQVLARAGSVLVGHVMIVTHWLQVGNGALLRTAYIELVATAQEYRNQGIGTRMMQKLAQYATECDYDLAALCPADTGLFNNLGWEYWRGPLSIRPNVLPGTKETPALLPTPEERVMILRLPKTPPLNLNHRLSAEWRGGGELW